MPKTNCKLQAKSKQRDINSFCMQIVLSPNELHTEFVVQNADCRPLCFTTALHAYYRVQSLVSPVSIQKFQILNFRKYLVAVKTLTEALQEKYSCFPPRIMSLFDICNFRQPYLESQSED